jgi:hypothetical protein
MVNMDDLLTVRPNGIVRAKAMNAVQRLDNPLLGAPFYNLLEYFDQVKMNRVGARDFGDAVDPNALNAKAHTAELVSNAAQERNLLKARVLAETVVKQIFWKILELVSKHQQKPQMVKLRNRWVQVDPREWKNKFNMTVTVGLGTGSQQAIVSNVNVLGQLFAGAMQMGSRAIQENNVYHLLRIAAKAMFPKEVDQLVTDPQTLPPPQPQPDPEMIKLELQDKWKQMADAQKRDKADQDAFLKQMQMEYESAKEQFKANVESLKKDKDYEVDIAKEAIQAMHEQRRVLMEKLAEAQKTEQENEGQKQLIALQGQVDALLERMKQVHEEALQAKELAAAEREHEVSERDAKGKIKKTVSRVKKKQ